MGMKRIAVIAMAVAGLTLAAPFAALAAPNNKNTFQIQVECGAPIGSTMVTVNARSNSASAFLPDGRVVVAKQFAGTGYLYVNGTVVATETFMESRGGHGRGHEGRLVTCTFQEVEEIFTGLLTAEVAAMVAAELGVDASVLTPYIGMEVALTAIFDGNVQVMIPGHK
jgi:membrane-bound inhibitor of C-type lysozyme